MCTPSRWHALPKKKRSPTTLLLPSAGSRFTLLGKERAGYQNTVATRGGSCFQECFMCVNVQDKSSNPATETWTNANWVSFLFLCHAALWRFLDTCVARNKFWEDKTRDIIYKWYSLFSWCSNRKADLLKYSEGRSRFVSWGLDICDRVKCIKTKYTVYYWFILCHECFLCLHQNLNP